HAGQYCQHATRGRDDRSESATGGRFADTGSRSPYHDFRRRFSTAERNVARVAFLRQVTVGSYEHEPHLQRNDGARKGQLAYAGRKVFKDRRLFIVGEIIHNPEVNHQIASLGIKNLTGRNKQAEISDLQPDDIVIVPAFGTELSMLQQIKERGCQIVDTTCGDVMSVWKRVRKYASESVTSIIHGKAEHEETKATSSRALGDGKGHYLVVLTLADTD